MVAMAVFIVPGISLAQTMSVSQLQQEIESLTAQLTTLQNQLTTAEGSTATWCYTFTTNLSIGMSGSAVTALQAALQKDGESVTVNGTFDDQTAAAVTGFQEKYASQILTPSGLSNGTGYAGRATRAELNALFGCGTGSNPVTPPIVATPIVSTPAPITTSPAAPYISQVSPTTATPGTTVTVTGQNFDTNSYISLGNVPNGAESFPVAVNSYTSTSLTFTVPSIGYAIGSNPIYVAEHNSNLLSNQASITISTPTSITVPTVTISVSPTVVTAGQATMLTWSSTNANTCTIIGSNGYNDDGSWTKSNLATSGSLSVTPYPTAQAPYVALYQITCTSSSGGSVTAATGLTVGAAPVPHISQVSPEVAAPNTIVTVTGQNFDANSYISLGNVPTGPENIPVPATSYTATSLTFTMPSSLVGPQPLYVAEHNSNFVSNQASITISSQSVVTVTAPTNGATLHQGSSQLIQWQTAVAGDPADVGLNLVQNGNSVLAIGNVPNTGSYSWTVPSSFVGSSFEIQIYGEGGYGDSGTFTISAPSAPSISQINPTTAAPGATVTVTGQNFDANSYIAIGNAPNQPESQSVTPSSYTSTSLIFVVPAYGISVGMSNPVYVVEKNSNFVSNEASLAISGTPYISQVSPITAAPGATVTVTGQNFDANSYISLGNVPNGPESFPVAVNSYTSTSLTFTIPSVGYAIGSNPIYVAEHNSSLVSNKASITISAQ